MQLEEQKTTRKKASKDDKISSRKWLDAKITPVRELRQNSMHWVIRVRVLAKSEIKTWRTAVAQGELFTVDLVDQEGTEILGSFLS